MKLHKARFSNCS